MSKSRHNHKWFDDEEDEEFHMGRNRAKKHDRQNNVKLEERRQQRRMVHEAKTKNLNYYEGVEEV